MKIAVLGGGLTGLTASFYLAKKGYRVTVFEKEPTLGGLAAGFKTRSWQWYLERSVHHLFANDHEILSFAKEVGFNKVFFRQPETASLYRNPKFEYRNAKQIPNPNVSNFKQKSLKNWNLGKLNLSALNSTYYNSGFQISDFEFRIFPLDTPYDLLRFPLLSFFQKLQAGLVLAFLKFSPFFSFYEKYTCEEFLKKTMGEEVWNILWQPLFRKKFGKYARKILSSFIWARIKKRTKRLGYFEGGFQSFINYLENRLKSLGVEIFKNFEIKKILPAEQGYKVIGYSKNLDFDMVISTLPTPVLVKIGQSLLPFNYLSKLKKIKYLHAISLILETDRPILKKTYWLNIATKQVPIMGIFQQTNFIDKKHYGGKHICYLGWYVEEKNKLWQMDKKQILDFILPEIKKINPNIEYRISNIFLFKSPFAQPIFDKNFLKNKPDFKTPLKNFYIANLDMTYPFDRGTNYAARLGKEVVKLINEKKDF